VAHFPLYALIVTNVTIVGNSEVEPAHQEASTDGLPVIQEFLRSIRTSRPGGSNLCNAAVASLSIGDYTSQCNPSGRLDGRQSRQR
jgi:hypothetical protein